MKIEKTVCPYCGANMKILPGQKQAECEYCGSSVVITGVESATQQERETHQESATQQESATHKEADWPKNRPTENPHPAAQNYEEHKAAAPVRHGIFPPPGFRSRNILHMIIAVCGYLFILAVAMSLGNAIDFIFFIAASLSVVDICLDWTGLWSRLKGLHSENRALRLIAKIIWSMVIFFVWILLMVIVEDIVGI